MKTALLSLFVFSILLATAQKPVTSLVRPKLVVGIVVDQMRWDYLYRYYDRYQPNGIKRLLNEGFTCENTYINYVPTVTAIGHASVYTGSVPAIHGIAGNEFIIQANGKSVYCTEDSTVQTVGSTSNAGKMSPRNLVATTITDELKLATNFRAKVIGIGMKDRGGILPAGHTPDAAYWFDNATGNWITSTYYMKELPEWVKKFNDQKLAEKYLKQDWNTIYAVNSYVQSSADNNSYEAPFSGSATPTFPVKTSGLYSKNYDVIRSTPFGNSLTADFAKAAIQNEQMGKDDITDFLAISFSPTDYIGHKFGANAVETEDTYLRLDKELAELFAYIDLKVGRGAYTAFVTADHAAAHNPNFLQDKNIPAGYFNMGQVQRELDAALEKIYKVKKLVLRFSNSQVHLNYDLIEKNNLDEESIRKDIVKFLLRVPNLSFVADNNKIEQSGIPLLLAERIRNGYNIKRSGVISFVLDPAYYAGSSDRGTGTTHGSWNPYDSHIPLLWMGWGINHGKSNRVINITDIAPTVAALLRIQEPNGCIGKPIEEVLKK